MMSPNRFLLTSKHSAGSHRCVASFSVAVKERVIGYHGSFKSTPEDCSRASSLDKQPNSDEKDGVKQAVPENRNVNFQRSASISACVSPHRSAPLHHDQGMFGWPENQGAERSPAS
ncbi:hypothetical protein chiPu_0006641 [Chiloscyllium punctatum]|uniref:Uncharacterized protein n=1 Tax=Chiloscyllium punctatum TaxID=137246 RepID=A0A401SCS5_CHIPU|nr:hypothetical protein [Chiloscyllium punctatum]